MIKLLTLLCVSGMHLMPANAQAPCHQEVVKMTVCESCLSAYTLWDTPMLKVGKKTFQDFEALADFTNTQEALLNKTSHHLITAQRAPPDIIGPSGRTFFTDYIRLRL